MSKDEDQFRSALLETIPHLRAFARMLARDNTMADDLVQDTIVSALGHLNQFQPGTNLRGWLIIILRNRYFNERRRSCNRMEIGVEFLPELGIVDGSQDSSIELRDFRRAFAKLPASQREALTLIGASGLSYEEAAELVGSPVGTLKSRVSRARAELQRVMEGGPNPPMSVPANRPVRRKGTNGMLEPESPPLRRVS